MIGLTLVMKHVFESLAKKAEMLYKLTVDSCTLVTRQRTSILKVGVTPMYQAFKIRVSCGYREIILA